MDEGLAVPRVVYRVVRTDPPTARDFLAPAQRGRRFQHPRQADLARGISVFRTENQARRYAQRYDLGRFIAQLELPPVTPISRTFRNRPGHHTVYADAEVLLGSVVRISPVE